MVGQGDVGSNASQIGAAKASVTRSLRDAGDAST